MSFSTTGASQSVMPMALCHRFSQTLPQARALTPQEQQQVDVGLQRWMPQFKPRLSTPLPQLLAHPGKAAPIMGLFFGGLMGSLVALFVLPLAGLMALFGLKQGRAQFFKDFAGMGTKMAGMLSVIVATFSTPVAYCFTKTNNENIVDVMKHHPSGATWGTMLQDPVYLPDFVRATPGNMIYKP